MYKAFAKKGLYMMATIVKRGKNIEISVIKGKYLIGDIFRYLAMVKYETQHETEK